MITYNMAFTFVSEPKKNSLTNSVQIVDIGAIEISQYSSLRGLSSSSTFPSNKENLYSLIGRLNVNVVPLPSGLFSARILPP